MFYNVFVMSMCLYDVISIFEEQAWTTLRQKLAFCNLDFLRTFFELAVSKCVSVICQCTPVVNASTHFVHSPFTRKTKF